MLACFIMARGPCAWFSAEEWATPVVHVAREAARGWLSARRTPRKSGTALARLVVETFAAAITVVLRGTRHCLGKGGSEVGAQVCRYAAVAEEPMTRVVTNHDVVFAQCNAALPATLDVVVIAKGTLPSA